MKNVVAKIEHAGNENIMLTERGISLGYHNLVVDMRSFPIMRSFGYPVVFDATHSVQLPGGAGTKSAGQRQFVGNLARAAAGAGIDGVSWKSTITRPKPQRWAEHAVLIAGRRRPPRYGSYQRNRPAKRKHG